MSERASLEPGKSDDSALRTVAKGLAGHKVLLFGFGVILIVSTTCQILRTGFTLYVWIVFAIYLVGSMIWLITRDHTGPPSPAPVDGFGTVIKIKRSTRIRDVGNRARHGGSVNVTIDGSEDVEGVANDVGQVGRRAHRPGSA